MSEFQQEHPRVCTIFIQFPDAVRRFHVVMDFNRRAMRRKKAFPGMWTTWRALTIREAMQLLKVWGDRMLNIPARRR